MNWFLTEIFGNPRVFMAKYFLFGSFTLKIHVSTHTSMWPCCPSILECLLEWHMQLMACLRSFSQRRTRLSHQIRLEIDFQGPNAFKKNAPTACCISVLLRPSRSDFWDLDIARQFFWHRSSSVIWVIYFTNEHVKAICCSANRFFATNHLGKKRHF